MSEDISRRALGLTAALGLAGGAVAGCSAERKKIATIGGLTRGVPLTFNYPDDHEAFVVKLGIPAEHGVGPKGDIVAFHVACPHMGCPMGLGDTEAIREGRLGPCACHQSTFDMTSSGRQLYGRATQNLVRVVLEVKGNRIFALGLRGVPFGEALAWKGE